MGKNDMIHLILMGGRMERKIAAGVINVTILSTIMGSVLKFTSQSAHPASQRVHFCTIRNGEGVESNIEEEGKARPRGDEPDQDAPIHSYRVITKDMKYPEEIGSSRSSITSVGRAGVPQEAEGGGHQPLRADRRGGGCVHLNDQQQAPSKLDDRLQRN